MPRRPKKAGDRPPSLSKLDLWLKHYLDQDNPATFLNATASSKAAGYRSSNHGISGQQAARANRRKILLWMNKEGLSEEQLKKKLLSLFDATDTKLQTLKGRIDEIDPTLKPLAVTAQTKLTPRGDQYEETETLVSIPVKSLEIQRKALDMALKIQGMYAPEKHEHNVKGRLEHTHEEALQRALLQKARDDLDDILG